MSTSTLSAGPSAPAPTSANIGSGITLNVPASGGSTATSPYGLTDGWGSQPINLSGFPFSIVQALSAAGLDTSTPQTGNAIAAALAKLPRAQAGQLQQMLFYAGFYPSTVTNLSDLQLGRFTAPDIAAMKSVVETAGQTGKPLGSYLTSAANYGMAQGTINQVAGVGVKPIPLPADADIDVALRAAAEKELGHAPSAELLSGFRAMYDQMLVSASKQAAALAAQNTATGLGDPEALGAAAGRLGEPGYFGDKQSAPPTPAPPPMIGLPSTQGPLSSRDQQLTAQQNAADYYNQHTSDVNTVGQFNQQTNANLANTTPTLTSAPNINTAAEQYVQQNDAQGVGANNVASKYATLLSILKGGG